MYGLITVHLFECCIAEKDGSVFIHHQNTQTLVTEMFKVKHELFPEITSNIFIEGTNCRFNLHHRKDFRTPHLSCRKNFRTPLLKSICHGTYNIA